MGGAVRFAMEKHIGDDGVRADVTVPTDVSSVARDGGDVSEAGASQKKKQSTAARDARAVPPFRRARVAAAAALDVPIPVELYDESRTSLQASLAVEASRGARGAAASLRPEARLGTPPPRSCSSGTSGRTAGRRFR